MDQFQKKTSRELIMPIEDNSFRIIINPQEKLLGLQQLDQAIQNQALEPIVIVIEHFKKIFHLEDWIDIVRRLRKLKQIKKIQFIDTKLTIHHIKQLRELLVSIKLPIRDLLFDGNALDDQDMDDFISNILKGKLLVSQLIIINNPGIFKCDLVKRIEQQITNSDDSQPDYYHLETDQQSYSIALIKLPKDDADEERQTTLEIIRNMIEKRQFINLELDSCFTKNNYRAFGSLIEYCYDTSQMEKLLALNINNNYLGSIPEFTKWCESISKSKGLLELHLQSQTNFQNSIVAQSLVGDRYDRLRLNLLDIGSNNGMLEKTWKIVVEGLISPCKNLYIQKTLPQELATLNKLHVWIQQGAKEVEQLKKLSEQKQEIQKLNLETLNLSKLENYNRHDLVRQLLDVLVYNEFSAIKTLMIQNVDDGRKRTYIEAKQQFQNIIKDKQHIPMYKNFRPTLYQIQIYDQSYKQDSDLLTFFYEECVFTRTTDLYTITTVKYFKDSFKIQGFQVGSEQFYEKIYKNGKNNPNYKLNVKKVHFKDSTINECEELIKGLFINPAVQLVEFCMETDSIYAGIFSMIHEYTQSLAPNIYYSLQHLSLVEISTPFDIGEILRTMIYNPKVRLNQFKLQQVTITVDEEKWKLFEEDYKNLDPDFMSMIKSLSFGQFENNKGIKEMAKYTLFDRHFVFQKLELFDQEFESYIDEYQECLKDLIDIVIGPTAFLQELLIQNLQINTQAGWKWFGLTFMIGQALQVLEISTMTITQHMLIGLQQLPEVCQELDLTFKICKFEADILSYFLHRQQLCVNKLAIKQSTGLDLQFQILEKIKQPKTCQIKSLNLNQTKVHGNSFHWFLYRYVLNPLNSCLNSLSMEECFQNNQENQDNNQDFDFLCYLINQNKKSKDFQLKYIDLSQNKDNVNEQQYSYLFQSLFQNTNEELIIQENKYKIDVGNFQKINNLISQNIDIEMEAYYGFQEEVINEIPIKNYEEEPEIEKVDQEAIQEQQQQEAEKAEQNYYEQPDQKEQQQEIKQFNQNEKDEKPIDWEELEKEQLSDDDGEKKNLDNNSQNKSEISEVEEKEEYQLQKEFQAEEPNKQIQENKDAQINQEKEQLAIEAQRIADYQQLLKTAEIFKLQSSEEYFNIQQKLIIQPNLFKQYVPALMNEVSLQMGFDDSAIIDCYYKSIKAFILFPGTMVKKLTLKLLNLNAFIISFQQARDEIQNQVDQNFKLNLEQLRITSLSQQNYCSTQLFVKEIVYPTMSNLQVLKLADFANTGLISSLLQFDQVYILKEIEFKNVSENLGIEKSKEFIDKIILGKLFNTEKLTLSEGILINIEEKTEFQKNEQSLLTDLDVAVKADQPYFQWLQRCQQIFTSGQYVKLKKLKITSANDPLLFDELEDAENIVIEELNLDFKLIWNADYLKLFLKLRTTLKELIIKQLFLSEEVVINDGIQILDDQPNLKLTFECLNPSQFEQTFMERIFFGRFFKINKAKITNAATISKIVGLNFYSFHQLQYLQLGPGLLYNSQVQLKEDALTFIGQQLIYNEASMLEHLSLSQCHLKPPGIFALVKGADDFRKRIKEQDREKEVYLRLKVFDLYYSLYIADAGLEKLAKNLIFFEYISLERLILEVMNLSDPHIESICSCADTWLEFQKVFFRQHQTYQFSILSIGRNEFVKLESSWKKIIERLLFSDLCPKLETLFMHFMGIDDTIGGYITKYVKQYLDAKPPDYIHQLKRYFFSFNKDLSDKGWEDLSRNIFFHPKIDLVELQLSSCMLDQFSKIEAVCNPAIEKALKKPNQKLALHTFNTFNLTNKEILQQYLSPRPDDFKEIPDQYVEPMDGIPYGILDGFQESYGSINSIIQKVIYKTNYLRKDNEWKQEMRHRWATFHLDFTESFIKIINDHYDQDTLYISLTTLDRLAKIFIYDITSNGEPYPLALLFQEKFFQYISDPSFKIKQIYIIPNLPANADNISQFNIYQYWQRIKNIQTKLQSIFIDYTVNDELFEQMFKDGYNEIDILHFLYKFPPSKIRTEFSLSRTLMSKIYLILKENQYYKQSNIIYDENNVINIGLLDYIKQSAYKKANGSLLQLALKNCLENTQQKYVLSDRDKFNINDFTGQPSSKFQMFQEISYIICLVIAIISTVYLPFEATLQMLLFLSNIKTKSFIIRMSIILLQFCLAYSPKQFYYYAVFLFQYYQYIREQRVNVIDQQHNIFFILLLLANRESFLFYLHLSQLVQRIIIILKEFYQQRKIFKYTVIPRSNILEYFFGMTLRNKMIQSDQWSLFLSFISNWIPLLMQSLVFLIYSGFETTHLFIFVATVINFIILVIRLFSFPVELIKCSQLDELSNEKMENYTRLIEEYNQKEQLLLKFYSELYVK